MKPESALLFSVLAVVLAGCDKPTAVTEPVRSVRVLTVGASALATPHEFSGDIRARVESRPGFRVSGKVLLRAVEVGQVVRAGQLLARLDASDLRLTQQAAEAAVSAARAGLELSEAEFKRFKDLRDQGFISAWELDRRESALKAAKAQASQVVAQAEVQGNLAAYADLKAEVGGVVLAVDVETGSVVAAGAPVLRLAHDGPREAVFAVPEDQVQAIRALVCVAGAVQVRAWGAAAQDWPATVREVAPAADPVTRTFSVRADLGAAKAGLGQTVTVRLPAGPAPGALKLPLSALFEHGGESAVWLLDSTTMTLSRQAVTIATADANQAVVAQGLRPGQQVVTAGVHVLAQGQKVRLYEPAPAPAAASAAPAR